LLQRAENVLVVLTIKRKCFDSGFESSLMQVIIVKKETDKTDFSFKYQIV